LPGRPPLKLGDRCLVMGILNVTPDSFAERATRLDHASAIDAALRMDDEGADIIDIGGESTRPGAAAVSADEELARVLPVLNGIAARVKAPISIDTSKAAVARAATDAGAVMINDISGLRFDAALARTAAAAGSAIVLMHSRGGPSTLHSEPAYEDLIGEIVSELRGSLQCAIEAGISADRVIVDPGIGFAKRPWHSYGVLAHLPEVAAALDRPLLAGPSRKSFMREALEDRPAADRDWGTAAAVTAAVLAGAHIVRVHAVKEMVQVVRVAEEIRRHG
jgi:dihydropteroate synthase